MSNDNTSCGSHPTSSIYHETANLNADNPLAVLIATLLPGFNLTPFIDIISTFLGVDITFYAFYGLIVFGLYKLGAYVFDHIRRTFEELYTVSLEINSADESYEYLLKWLVETKRVGIGRGRHLAVRVENTPEDTKLGEVWPFSYSDLITPQKMHGWFSESLIYEPALGRQYFFFKGRLFRLTRWKETIEDGPGSRRVSTRRYITEARLTTIGTNTRFLEGLMAEVMNYHAALTASVTKIRRPAPFSLQWRNQYWYTVSKRAPRPLKSIAMSPEIKDLVLRDIYSYIHPNTYDWYAERGIPYRRGYLFYGPPGTGKTSLAFAVAGMFNLEIYALNLQNQAYHDELDTLFENLPKRCVLLLEDIDCAGLSQRKSKDLKKRKLKKAEKKKQKKRMRTRRQKLLKEAKLSKIQKEWEEWEKKVEEHKKNVEEETKVFEEKQKEDKEKREKEINEQTSTTTEENGLSTPIEPHSDVEPELGEVFVSKLVAPLTPDNLAALQEKYASKPRDRDDISTPPVSSVASSESSVASSIPEQVQYRPWQTPLSLSTLLNLIDGVAAPEGRILIMTTNHIDRLDEALIRPGRVDLKVECGFLSRRDVQGMFERAYQDHGHDVPSKIDDDESDDEESTPKKVSEVKKNTIKDLAVRFAGAVPEHFLSGAQVQGHLLNFKTDPEAAVQSVGNWIERLRGERREKKRRVQEIESEDEDGNENGRERDEEGI